VSGIFTNDFSGQELLLLLRLQADPGLFQSWKENLLGRSRGHEYDRGEIPQSLWFMAVTLDRKRDRLLDFIKEQIQLLHPPVRTCQDSLLARYLHTHAFVELNLDGIFKYGDDNTLPLEIFRCPSVRRLSLKYNYLDRIPADIGRMANLEYLALTNNKLQNKSLPYTLTFCTRLRTLLLDNNLLDALPGFLLKMSSLETVHRHGNHNYFKSTFMWYHTDFNERILKVPGSAEFAPSTMPGQNCPQLLQFWAAKVIAGSKVNFYVSSSVAPILRDFISDVYDMFSVCGYCNKAVLAHLPGYKVITFKNPYLGNTCVPFQHWVCSMDCAMRLETPAREEQIAAARELDRQYDAYVRECHRQYHANTDRLASSSLLCTARRQHYRQSHVNLSSSSHAANYETVDAESVNSRHYDGPEQSSSISSSSSSVAMSCFGSCHESCCIS
jgi:hypothetical protein